MYIKDAMIDIIIEERFDRLERDDYRDIATMLTYGFSGYDKMTLVELYGEIFDIHTATHKTSMDADKVFACIIDHIDIDLEFMINFSEVFSEVVRLVLSDRLPSMGDDGINHTTLMVLLSYIFENESNDRINMTAYQYVGYFLRKNNMMIDKTHADKSANYSNK